MTINLTPEHERIIQAQIASGKFHSVDEVLDQALALLKPAILPCRKAKAQMAADSIRELRKGVTLDPCANTPVAAGCPAGGDVPSLWPWEMMNALSVRRQRITAERAKQFFDQLSAFDFPHRARAADWRIRTAFPARGQSSA